MSSYDVFRAHFTENTHDCPINQANFKFAKIVSKKLFDKIDHIFVQNMTLQFLLQRRVKLAFNFYAAPRNVAALDCSAINNRLDECQTQSSYHRAQPVIKSTFFVVLDRRHTFSVQFPSCSLPIFNKKVWAGCVRHNRLCFNRQHPKNAQGLSIQFFKKRPHYVSSHSLASLMLYPSPCPPTSKRFYGLRFSAYFSCHTLPPGQGLFRWVTWGKNPESRNDVTFGLLI